MKAIQLKAIRSLLNAHNGAQEIISVSLARRLANAAFISHRTVAAIIDRRGTMLWVVVGDATRLYLPDIGRIRGGRDRLRGLRLIVARPTPLNFSEKNYVLSHDLRTDLEKLRLDALIELDASRENVDGSLVLAYLSSRVIDNNSYVVAKSEVFSCIHDLRESFPSLLARIIDDLAEVANSDGKALAKRERAILIGIYNSGRKEALRSMAELEELARSANVEVANSIIQIRHHILPRTAIGLQKLEEICLLALSLGIEMLIFDRELSPSQLSNITDLTDLKILDRTMLILDIFAQRAVTREGKLQVEMAQLNYSLPRLAKKQSGLSRLTGGIGGRGPGETKLEVNRRRVKERLARLAYELEKIKKQRELRRKVRKTHELPTLAIVGYTNAGKSTLLNALSGSSIYAKDELFATLDPHSKRLRFPHDQEVLITDTVGFINHLPNSLMRAFMATLEELQDADLLIHVVDIANENYQQHVSVVNGILTELNLGDRATILVLNKIDELDDEELNQRAKKLPGIKISAKKRIGLTNLLEEASRALNQVGDLTAEKCSKLNTNRTEQEVVFDGR